MLIIARSYTFTQRLHSSEFTPVDKVVHSNGWLLGSRTKNGPSDRRSEVGVVQEVTWNVGGALRSLGHVGGAQFSRAARDRSAVQSTANAQKPEVGGAGHVNARHGWGWT